MSHLTPEQPTGDQCTKNAVLSKGEHDLKYADWQFQWGGYVGICVVEVNVGGCFDVWVWHDGEFPRNDDEPDRYHYCDPMQLVTFALTVMEKQHEFSRERDSEITDDLMRARASINELLAKVNAPK